MSAASGRPFLLGASILYPRDVCERIGEDPGTHSDPKLFPCHPASVNLVVDWTAVPNLFSLPTTAKDLAAIAGRSLPGGAVRRVWCAPVEPKQVSRGKTVNLLHD